MGTKPTPKERESRTTFGSNQKLLIIGSEGSIGKRYQAICRFLSVPFKTMDVEKDHQTIYEMLDEHEPTHVLIASPTQTHYGYAKEMTYRNIPFLVEKPVSKSLKECEELSKLSRGNSFVVNNWSFLSESSAFPKEKISHIKYDYYQTGKDGLIWDVCQLLYLTKKAGAKILVETQSYFWDVRLNENTIPHRAIEESYALMLRSFLENDRSKLWNLEVGLEMTKICRSLVEKSNEQLKGFSWNSSTDKFITTAGEDLQTHRRSVAS